MDPRKSLQFRNFFITFQELLTTVKTFKILQIFHKKSQTFCPSIIRSTQGKQMHYGKLDHSVTETNVDFELTN